MIWTAVLAGVAGLPALACLGAAVAFARGFRPVPGESVPGESVPSLTMVVPVRGADVATGPNLEALVTSRVDVPVEYLVAMESADDPAHEIAEQVRRRHPEADVRVVITGPAGERMGKQHNLAAAARVARHDALGSMDADVRVGPGALAAALRRLAAPDAGVAYLLPCYAGGGPAGGRLVALYSNEYYQLNMGALALTRNAPFITGGLWLMSPSARERIGGPEPFTATISDDAAIGRAVVAAGLRTELVPQPVTMAFEALDLTGGARHLLKWLTLLRAEGLPAFLAILVTWHPVLWGALAVASAVAVPAARPGLPVVAAVAVAGLLARLGATAVLHRRALGGGTAAALALLVPYEIVAVPVLFARALFSRRLVWRGREYVIGRGGVIRSTRIVDADAGR